MAYKRKTETEWYIEQYTCNGWEEVTCDSSLQHHLENLSLYRKEGYLVRGKTRRIKLSEEINND